MRTPKKKGRGKVLLPVIAVPDAALRLKGYISWTDGSIPGKPYEVDHAVLRNGMELAIECYCSPGGTYTIVLSRLDEISFRGEWSFVMDAFRDTGTCTCRLYTNGIRYGLIGAWHEEGQSSKWFGELEI